MSEPAVAATIDLHAEFEASGVAAVLAELDRALIGLAPVKKRIRETADLLHRLGYIRRGHLVAVTRDDLVGQSIGHTAPKTKEILKKAMGGVLFIDEAYSLYRPENERDYGQEAIEILLQVVENNRDDLVVILAGYAGRMERFFESNPGFRSRIAHHIDFPDYTADELFAIAERMLAQQNCHLDAGGQPALTDYIALRRARLRQANRLFDGAAGPFDVEALSAISAEDISASRVFSITINTVSAGGGT